MRLFLRIMTWALASGGGAISLPAEALAADIARIHVEAIGGQDRVNRLQSFRAAGQSQLGDVTLDFQMWAARPRSIRIEVMMGNQTLIQGWNGLGDPWIQGGSAGVMQPMPANVKDRFMSESDFDTPLVNPEGQGYVLEYAGEDEVADRPVVKLLATRNLTDQSLLYLAADTYFIVRQDRTRTDPDGTRVATATYYSDFRPVLGVILPHQIRVYEGEKLASDVMLSWIEPNPPMDAAMFGVVAETSVPERVEDLKAPPAEEQGERILELAN